MFTLRFTTTASFCAAILFCVSAHAQSISSTTAINNSSADEATGLKSFQTQSTLGSTVTSGNTSSFQHHLSLLNQMSALGNVAQVNKKNAAIQLDFTVSDPTNAGYILTAESLIRGISSITQTSGSGTALATGLFYSTAFDDSTDAPNTYSTVVDLFSRTSGVSVNSVDTATALQEDVRNTVLGTFTGTLDFSLRFTTSVTPTTNVLFNNFNTGSGEVNYGLGVVAPGINVSQADLGHFVTVTATSVPEPSCALLLGLGLTGLCLRRRRDHSAA